MRLDRFAPRLLACWMRRSSLRHTSEQLNRARFLPARGFSGLERGGNFL